jgi:hypothetical protein
MTLDRRRFLQITAAGVVATLTTSTSAAESRVDVSGLEKPELLTMLGAERVREIGIRYRAATPDENTASSLHAALFRTGPGKLLFRWSPLESIRNQIRDDFAAGRTVMLDGWVLSATEARQCALFSLASA